MKRDGIHPSLRILSAMMQPAVQKKDMHLAGQVFKLLADYKLKPGVIIYTQLLRLVSQVGEHEHILGILSRMQREGILQTELQCLEYC